MMRAEWPQWALLFVMFLAPTILFPMVPEQIPSHWGPNGQADGYGNRWVGLFMLPTIATAIYILLLLAPKIDPGRANYERFGDTYKLIRLALLLFFSLFEAAVLAAALGYQFNMNTFVFPTMGVLFLILGNCMGKIRPNWFCGIRTPWTLSSKLSWTKTHRLGGRLFMLVGIVTIFTVFLSPPWNVGVLVGSTLLMTAWVFVYSYLVWRHDPDRVPPSGTTPADD
jgi:uncharacterized membrane protein